MRSGDRPPTNIQQYFTEYQQSDPGHAPLDSHLLGPQNIFTEIMMKYFCKLIALFTVDIQMNYLSESATFSQNLQQHG